MTRTLSLPNADGSLASYTTSGRSLATIDPPKNRSVQARTVFAACHVVADPTAATDPSLSPSVDWPTTLAFRRYLHGLGLGIAEAMDTAQRGMGLDWPVALELIKQTKTELPDALVFNGCGTDHLDSMQAHTLADVERAYTEQIAAIQALDARIILMASRALARVASSAEDYLTVYSKALSQCDKPVILHWLGDMFDPQLAGYWGATDIDSAMQTCLQVISENENKVDGIKISLLDKEREITMRRLLPDSVRMYTGDDFNYPELIAGDDAGFSHALLGIFDPLAPLAALANRKLDDNDITGFREVLDPTVPLARHIFKTPTQHYKTGVVFLAWLNGHQQHFVMVNGAQAQRSLPHFAELFRLADQCGLFVDPELASDRFVSLMRIYGIHQ